MNQTAEALPPEDKSMLKPGEVVADRYVITESVTDQAGDTVYTATDHDARQRWCSVCDVPVIPPEDDPFCDECGSELQPGHYLLTVWPVEAEPPGLDAFFQAGVTHDHWRLPVEWFIWNEQRIMAQPAVTGDCLDAVQGDASRDEIMSWGLTLADIIQTLHGAGFFGFKNNAGPFMITEDRRLVWVKWQGFAVYPSDPPFDEEEVRKAQQMDLAALASMLTVWLLEGDGEAEVEVAPDLRTYLNELSSGVYTDAGEAARQLEILLNPAPQAETVPRGPVRYAAAGRSDTGRARQGKVNEDSLAMFDLTAVRASVQETAGLYVVADGVGGHDRGELASRIAVGTMIDHMTRHLVNPALDALTEDNTADLMVEAVEAANAAVCEAGLEKQADINTTITAALLVGNRACIANVGDSRTYLYRDGSLKAVTTDHSLVARLVAIGMIETDDIYTHPQKNQIYRVLGGDDELDVDIFEEVLLPGDTLLLCSDGLWDMVRDPAMEQILEQTETPAEACDALVERANQNGGEDNISVIVVQMSAYEDMEQ